jgi:GntR family transcriptional regulator
MKVPKYFHVKTQILALISDLAPGDAVPTERDLAERLATSRTTVRRAIAELVADGRVVHTQGSGTFVAPPKLMQVRQLTSFSQDLTSEGWRPGSVLLDIAELPAAGEVAERLGLREGQIVHRVERIRTAADEPIAHEIAHVPGPLAGFAGELAARGSLYATLREAYAVELDVVEDTVETALADPQQASMLECDIGLPMLLVHRTGWDVAGRPVEWTRSVFRGDRFRFVARQQVGGAAPPRSEVEDLGA